MVHRTTANAYRTEGGTGGKSFTTVMFCGSATGQLLPPFVIYKSKRLFEQWILGGPPNAGYSCSDRFVVHFRRTKAYLINFVNFWFQWLDQWRAVFSMVSTNIHSTYERSTSTTIANHRWLSCTFQSRNIKVSHRKSNVSVSNLRHFIDAFKSMRMFYGKFLALSHVFLRIPHIFFSRLTWFFSIH